MHFVRGTELHKRCKEDMYVVLPLVTLHSYRQRLHAIVQRGGTKQKESENGQKSEDYL